MAEEVAAVLRQVVDVVVEAAGAGAAVLRNEFGSYGVIITS